MLLVCCTIYNKKKTVLGREQDYLSSFHNERRFKRIDNEMAYRKLSSYAAQKMSKHLPDAFIELERQVQSEPAKLRPIGVYFHLEQMLCLFLLNQVSTH